MDLDPERVRVGQLQFKQDDPRESVSHHVGKLCFGGCFVLARDPCADRCDDVVDLFPARVADILHHGSRVKSHQLQIRMRLLVRYRSRAFRKAPTDLLQQSAFLIRAESFQLFTLPLHCLVLSLQRAPPRGRSLWDPRRRRRHKVRSARQRDHVLDRLGLFRGGWTSSDGFDGRRRCGRSRRSSCRWHDSAQIFRVSL